MGYDRRVASFAPADAGRMVAIAQLVEHRLVVPVVAGSSPVSHPDEIPRSGGGFLFFEEALPRRPELGQNGRMASAPKTQPTDADVHAFLDAATPARRRADGLALAEIFHEVTGEAPVLWGPSIVGYGSYHYVSPANPRTRGEWMKTGFSPRKAQLSLYGLKDLPEGAALLTELGRYTEGAGCVYVRTLDDIDLGVLRRLIAIAWGRPDGPAA